MAIRTILRAFAMYSLLGAVFAFGSFGFVLGEERPEAKIHALAADAQIASLLTKIETGLRDNQAASSAGLLEMLVSAKSLLPDATAAGTRMMHDFPDRLMKVADKEPELAKSINLKVFASSVGPFVGDQKPVAAPKPVDSPEVVAMVQSVPVAPPPAPTPNVVPVVAKPQVAPPAPMPDIAPVIAKPVAPAISTELQQTLVQRGDAALSLDDILAARLLYQHAADTGMGLAAFKLANTYDSDFIVEHKLHVKPDWAQAAIWYRKAEALGEPRAEQRLQVMLSSRRTP